MPALRAFRAAKNIRLFNHRLLYSSLTISRLIARDNITNLDIRNESGKIVFNHESTNLQFHGI
jgi:hypothetical protein